MAFVKLPLELNELIASFLTDDNDLCRFTLLCHVTHDAVHSHYCTVWRDRFHSKFDLPPGRKGFALKTEYQIRQKVLCRGYTGLFPGDLQEDICFIHVLRNLIVGTWKAPSTDYLHRCPEFWIETLELRIVCWSYPIFYSESFANDRHDPSGEPVSYNLRHLNGIVRRSKLLDYDIRWTRISRSIGHTILVFRLLCSHLAFESAVNSSIEMTHTTQQTLFSNNILRSLFRKRMTTINILLLVNIVDFFRKYLKSETTSEIFQKFKNLAKDEKPNIWQGPLKHGTRKLGKSWKGTYGGLSNPFHWKPHLLHFHLMPSLLWLYRQYAHKKINDVRTRYEAPFIRLRRRLPDSRNQLHSHRMCSLAPGLWRSSAFYPPIKLLRKPTQSQWVQDRRSEGDAPLGYHWWWKVTFWPQSYWHTNRSQSRGRSWLPTLHRYGCWWSSISMLWNCPCAAKGTRHPGLAAHHFYEILYQCRPCIADGPILPPILLCS